MYKLCKVHLERGTGGSHRSFTAQVEFGVLDAPRIYGGDLIRLRHIPAAGGDTEWVTVSRLISVQELKSGDTT